MTQTSAALTITQGTNNGGADVTSVKVYYATNGSPTTDSTSQNFTDVSDNEYTVTGLTAGTAYTFKATSTNSAGESALSAEVTGSTPAATTVPDAPTISASPTMTLTSAALTITQAPDNGGATVTSVKVYYDTGTPTTSSDSQNFTDVSGSTYTVVGLTPGTVYRFKATTRNSVGESALSGEVTGTTVAITAPGVPTFSALTMKKEEADATIAPSAETGGAAVTAVNLYYRIPPAEFPAKGSPNQTFTTLASDFIYTVTGLTTKTAYEFRATTSNSAGESDFSTPVNTGTTEGVPDAPTIATTTNANVGISTMDLTITQATDNGGQPVSAIKVYYRNASRPESFPASNQEFTPASDNEYQVTGLKPDSMYQFRAVSVNSHGESPFSALQPTVTTASTSFPIVTTSDITTTGVKVSFLAVTYAIGYEVQHREGSTGAWTTSPQITETEYALSALKPSTLYQVQVRTIYGDGIQSAWGPASPQEVTTLALSVLDPQSAPTNFSATVSGIQVAIEWTPVPDTDAGTNATSIKNHELQGSRTTDFGLDEITGTVPTTLWRPALLDGDAELTAHSGLTPGHVWHYRIRAINDNDLDGPWSEIVTVRIPGGGPAKPVLTTTVNSTRQITVTWTEPDSGASAIIGYELQRAPKLNPLPQEFEDIQSGPAKTRTDVDLMPSTAYSYRVRGINGLPSPHDEGVWSDVVVGTTQSLGGGTAPSAVRNLRGASDGTKIILTWDAPSSGTPPYQYVVQEHDGTDFKAPGTTITARTYEFTGGVVGRVYRFRVRATNPDGSSPWEETSLGLGERPDAPTALTATRAGTTITLTWTQGGSTPATGYRIEVRLGSAATWTALEANTGNANKTYAHLETVPATRYRYRVAAINDNGTSAFSNEANVPSVTGPGLPGKVSGLGATRNGTDITLTWSAPSGTVVGYTIQVSEGDGALNWTTIVESQTALTYKHSSTDPKIRYRYRVAARNASGIGTYSDVGDARVIIPKLGKPPDFVGVRNGTNIILGWSAPSGTVTGYRIQVTEGDGSPEWFTIVESQTARTYTHAGRNPNTRYRYRVAGINDGGVGTYSDVVDIIVPTRPPPKVGDLSVARQHPNIVLSWTAPAGAITGYKVEVRAGEGLWEALSENTASQSTRYEHLNVSRNVRYHYRVSAINDVGTGPSSDIVTSEIDLTVPSVVRDVRAEREHPEIVISWVEPTSNGGTLITGYKIEVAENNDEFKTLVSETSHDSYTHKNTKRATRYRYRIYAINSQGTGPVSAVAEAPRSVQAPTAPRDVRATVTENNGILIQWVEPTDDGGSDIRGYRIEYRIVGRAAWLLLKDNTAVTSDLSYVHEDVEQGTEYEYRVAALNQEGRGDWSSAANAVTDDTPGPPRLRASGEAGQIRLQWDPPAHTGGEPILSYRIDVSEDDGLSWLLLFRVGEHTRGYTHERLPPGAVRTYRMRAANSIGEGAYSNVVTARTYVEPASQPRDLQARAVKQEIELVWLEPQTTGGSEIESYRIEMSTDNARWTLVTTTARGLRYVITGQPPDSERAFRVAAINEAGTGAWSSIVKARTDPTRPDPPTVALAVPLSSTSIKVTWNPPQFAGGTNTTLIGYMIEMHGGGDWVILNANTQSLATQYIHEGLEPGKEYHYRISALNRVGASDPSIATSARTIVDPATRPRDLQANVVDQETELVWLEPESTGGSDIKSYRVESSSDGVRWSLVTTTATGLRYVITGIPPDTERSFRVAAITEAGRGAWSAVVKARTEPTVPDPPSVVSALARSSTSIGVAWNAPIFTGGQSTALTGYRIEMHRGGVWVTVLETRSLATLFVHTDLEPGTEYHYRISALNRIGASDPSTTVSARTHAVTPQPPTGLTVSAEGSNRLRLRWNEPDYLGGGTLQGYQIEGNRDGTWKVLEPNTRSAQRDYLHVGLEPATSWSYRISAINEAGMSGPSRTATGTTDPVVPAAPRGLRAEADGDQIELNWQPPDYAGGARLTGYRIEASRDRTTWDMLVRNTNHTGTTYLHFDLPPASTWHYRVYAINEAGVSPASLEASATTEAVEPGAPESVTATALDHESVLIEWEAPRFKGGARIIGYKIEFSVNEGDSWTVLEFNTNERRTEYEHRGLEPATVYSYRVYAINRIGVGPVSPSTTIRTMADVPDPPTDLIAEAVAPDQINLDWSPPEYDGGAEVRSYLVEHTIHLEVEWEIIGTPERSEWSHEDLLPGETHYYRVSAVNEAGASSPSNVAEAATDDTSDRIERLNRTILPRFASTVASGIVRSVSDRMDAIAHKRAGYVKVAPLNVIGTGGLDALVEGTSASRSFGSRLSAWGNADKMSMSSVAENMRWEGDVLSLYTGSDMEVAKGLFMGLSASHSTGRYGVTDFLWEETEGKYRVGMTSVTPYAGWTPSSTVSAWTSGSYSFGEIEVEEGPREIRTSSLTMTMGAAGLIGRLTSSEFGALNLKVEGWAAHLDVRQASDFNPVILDLRRVRTAIEWQRINRMNGDHEFTLLANAGLRHDFNEAVLNHSGFEFGGGAGYSSPSRRMRLTATGRMLVTTDADYNEWGIGGGVHIEPPPAGGLAIRADPSYGRSRSGVEQLWNTGITTLASERQFVSPVSIEYHTAVGAKPYVRLNRKQVFVGTTLKGLSIEGLGGNQRGLAIKGQWRFQ